MRNPEDLHNNRVEGIIAQIEQCYFQYKYLEEEYEGKKKGNVYNERVRLLDNKIKSLKKKIMSMGSGQLKHWKISYYDSKDIHNSFEFCLQADVTDQEIISYYEHFHKVTVESLAEIQTVEMGFYFPRSDKN